MQVVRQNRPWTGPTQLTVSCALPISARAGEATSGLRFASGRNTTIMAHASPTGGHRSMHL